MWTSSQLAEKTGLTRQHITRLIRQGKIEAERLTMGYVIQDEEAERFIAERTEPESQEAAD
jgi:excisionase family DNA binding protein